MVNLFRAAAGVALVALSAPALAAIPSVTFVENSNSVSGTIFADFEDGAQNVQVVAKPGTTVVGDVRTLTGNTAGVGIGPTASAGNFLTVAGNSSYTVQAPSAAYLVSFLVGTLDTYNVVTLITNLGTYTLTGREIFGLAPVPGEPANLPAPNSGAVTYTFAAGEVLQSISFSSAQTAFEIDSIAFATPEPGTWAMLILGFGLAGFGIRRRKRRSTLAFA